LRPAACGWRGPLNASSITRAASTAIAFFELDDFPVAGGLVRVRVQPDDVAHEGERFRVIADDDEPVAVGHDGNRQALGLLLALWRRLRGGLRLIGGFSGCLSPPRLSSPALGVPDRLAQVVARLLFLGLLVLGGVAAASGSPGAARRRRA